MTEAIPFVFAAWLPAVAIAFRVLGPRRAAPIAVLGGFLFLPREASPLSAFGWLSIDKRTVSGTALILGLLVSDPRALLRGRPRLLDLPMAAFVLLPLASLAANRFENHLASIDQVWMNFSGWAMPYLVGRLYFGDRDGPRQLSVAIVVAGLVYIPVCLFEVVMGPDYYLLGLIYGIPPHRHMVERLGGWRPEGFLTNGIELATWMALAATTAAWLRLRRGWVPWRFPPWTPTVALAAMTVACRGVYGHANLALGLTTAGLSHLLRTRLLIAALAIVPPAYIASRVSGAWDGRQVVELAGRAGKADTVAYRLRAEDSYIKKVFEHNALLGFGGGNSAIFDWFAQRHLWADGWWIHQLRSGGLVGLVAFLLALFLVPTGVALATPAGRSGRASPGALGWGLALFVVGHSVDSLQNMALLTPTPLVGGALISLFLARHSCRPHIATIAREPDPGRAAARDSRPRRFRWMGPPIGATEAEPRPRGGRGRGPWRATWRWWRWWWRSWWRRSWSGSSPPRSGRALGPILARRPTPKSIRGATTLAGRVLRPRPGRGPEPGRSGRRGVLLRCGITSPGSSGAGRPCPPCCSACCPAGTRRSPAWCSVGASCRSRLIRRPLWSTRGEGPPSMPSPSRPRRTSTRRWPSAWAA